LLVSISGATQDPAPRQAESKPAESKPAEADDVRDVPSKDTFCNKNESQRYFLIGPVGPADKPPDRPGEKPKPPKNGYTLLVVMPGGDGGADFHSFVKRVAKHAAGGEFLVAQLVSKYWSKSQKIVWPTKGNPVPSMEFTTEQFAEAVIAEISKQQKIDPKRVYTLSWSSSGPAAYAIAFQQKTAVRGSLIAMSVFNAEQLPPAKNAAARKFYLLHSPADETCKFEFAEKAQKQLQDAGARVTLEKYDGGHGWKGPVYDMISKGLRWLEAEK
jgi:predicted esterase